MKTIAKLSLAVALTLALLSPGCKKSEPPAVDTTPTLQQAFETAAPALKQGVEAVATNLKAKNYAEATKALETVASNPTLTDPQKEAALGALRQISDAIAADPKLATPEMAASRARIFGALRRGAR